MLRSLQISLLAVALFAVSSECRSTSSDDAREKTAPIAHAERRVLVTFNIGFDLAGQHPRDVRLWLPYPPSDEYQTVELVDVEGNFTTHTFATVPHFGTPALYAEWYQMKNKPSLSLTFRVTRKEVRKKQGHATDQCSYEDIEQWLKPAAAGIDTADLNSLARTLTQSRTTELELARAIYEYIVENFERDPLTPGCGLGDVQATLDRKKGKCVDLHSVLVSLARAAGLPAREVMGIRIPKGSRGLMTDAYHCWAELYVPDIGWIPLDPSDVVKARLEQNLPAEQLEQLREYYFGAVDANRIALGTGRNVLLHPQQTGGRLNYFMYPYAEIEGRPLDWLSQEELVYAITFEEL